MLFHCSLNLSTFSLVTRKIFLSPWHHFSAHFPESRHTDETLIIPSGHLKWATSSLYIKKEIWQY